MTCLGNNLSRCLSAGDQPFCSLCVHVLHFVSVSLHVRVVHVVVKMYLSVSGLPFCFFSVHKCSIFVRDTPCEQFAVVMINDCQDVLGEWKYSLYLCSQIGATPQWDVVSLISGS